MPFLPRFVSTLLVCLAAGVAVAEPGVPDAADALQSGQLVQALRQGGLVIYFRHADTGPAYQEQGIDLARCETQRNLNDKGRREASDIGKQFGRLQVPVGEVRASQFCRCRETAELAFAKASIDPVLTGVSRAPEAADRRAAASAGLKRLLAARPAAGTNTILVSHGYNLWDAEGFHLGTQGEAAVYRPDGSGGYALLARLQPGDWAALPQP